MTRVECSPPKPDIDHACKGKTLVGRVKLGLNLADGTAESDKTFRNIRQTAKLITGDYFDFKKPWREQGDGIISRAVKDCIHDIPQLIPFCFDANCRINGVHLLARDLLMLLCQDESRNCARKPNAAKKARGEEVKLGRRTISKGICCLAILTTRFSQDIVLSLLSNTDSGYISTWLYHLTICSSKFACWCVFCASSSSLSALSYSSRFSATYS